MSVNIFLFIVFTTIVVAIVSFVFFERNFTDPLKRQKEFIDKLFNAETLSDIRAAVMTVYKYDSVIGKFIIPFSFLNYSNTKGYRVGRIAYNRHRKKLKDKIAYKIYNRDLFYGIECSGCSGLSSNQFFLHKILTSDGDTLALTVEHDYNTGKGLYRVEDKVQVNSGNYYALFPSGDDKSTFSTYNNVYTFEFELCDIDKNYFELENIRREYFSNEQPKTEKKLHKQFTKAFFGNDETEPDVVCSFDQNTAKKDTDKTKPYYYGKDNDTKLYVPGQRKQQHQHQQDYPKVL